MDKKHFLVTADDVGIINSIDKAVQKLIDKGVINNISIFINTNHNKAWIKELSEDVYLSLHLTFSYGKPITEQEWVPSLVNDDGFFLSPHKPSIGNADGIDKSIQDFLLFIDEYVSEKELELECKAQVNEFCNVFGREPDYINVHHDLDKSNKICRVIKKCCPEYQTRQMLLDSKQVECCLYHFLPEKIDFGEAMNLIGDMFQTARNKNEESGKPVELIFHPAFYSEGLQKFSSYAVAREIEYKVLLKLAECGLL